MKIQIIDSDESEAAMVRVCIRAQNAKKLRGKIIGIGDNGLTESNDGEFSGWSLPDGVYSIIEP